VVYGPQTTLVLALGGRVDIFILDRRSRQFVLVSKRSSSTRYAGIRHQRLQSQALHGPVRATSTNAWPALTATAVPTSICGGSARWSPKRFASWCVAACFCIRPTPGRLSRSRLRLLYEAHPMALIMEWPGRRQHGRRRILELGAKTPHQRVPLIMGSVPACVTSAIHEGISRCSTIATRRCLRGAAVSLTDNHHVAQSSIISITGSSAPHDVGETNFENIFRAKRWRSLYRGDAFHRYNRVDMRTRMAEEAERGNKHFSHFSPETNLFEELEHCFATTANPARHTRITSTTTTRPSFTAQSRHLYRMGSLPENSDLLF